MARYNNHKRQHLFCSWGYLSPKKRQMLDKSWPELFQKYILTELPETELIPFFQFRLRHANEEPLQGLRCACPYSIQDAQTYTHRDLLKFNSYSMLSWK